MAIDYWSRSQSRVSIKSIEWHSTADAFSKYTWYLCSMFLTGHINSIILISQKGYKSSGNLRFLLSIYLIIWDASISLVADSWPQVLEDSNARKDWAWRHEYDLNAMTAAMLEALAPTGKVTAVVQWTLWNNMTCSWELSQHCTGFLEYFIGQLFRRHIFPLNDDVPHINWWDNYYYNYVLLL